MKSIMVRRMVATITGAAAVGSLTVLVAAPANAEVRGTCAGPVCTASDIAGYTVNDITVSTTDGANADLHAFVYHGGNGFDGRQPNSREFRFAVGKTFDAGTLVCGEAWANGHLLGRPCITL